MIVVDKEPPPPENDAEIVKITCKRSLKDFVVVFHPRDKNYSPTHFTKQKIYKLKRLTTDAKNDLEKQKDNSYFFTLPRKNRDALIFLFELGEDNTQLIAAIHGRRLWNRLVNKGWKPSQKELYLN